MAGWGDHAWGTVDGPWGGCSFLTPNVTGLMISWEDPKALEINKPPTCRRAARLGDGTPEDPHALCGLFPEFYCREDLDTDVGGTGDHHRLLSVLGDFLYGSVNQGTGIADDIASFSCIIDPDEAPERFLDAMLLHLGFTLSVPLSEAEKRKVIPLLVSLYKRKGTEPGIEEALRLLLGIPVNIIQIGAGVDIDGIECGEDFSRTVSNLISGGNFVEVSNPERFEIGKDLVITDVTPPYADFLDTPILDIQSNRIFFAAQVLTDTIEAGAQIFCDRYCDQVGTDGFDLDCDEIGADSTFGSQDPALYSFYVDIQKTVATTTVLEDGDTEVDLDDTDFIIKGSRVRLTDQVAPINVPVVVVVKEKTGLTITFDAVSLTETIEIGAAAINLFNSEELALIDEIVKFAKPAHTHHTLTRDDGDAEAEVG